MLTDLQWIAQRAQDNRDDYDAFRYYVEDDDRSDSELDALVEKLVAPITATIDCTTCGNCCRSLDVYLTPNDAARLANALNCADDYIEHTRAQSEGEWGMLRERPCAFLNGNLCILYDHRPQSCRDYPAFTPDFRWQLEHILGGVGLCPIIYNVIEALKHQMNW